MITRAVTAWARNIAALDGSGRPGGEAPIGAGDVIDSLPDAIRGVQEA